MKPVPSCPGYFASEDGQIYRNGTARRPTSNGRGYLRLKVSIANKQWDEYVHRMVCEAYHGPCPEGFQCRHLDGSRSNNRPHNLEWSDKMTNEADKRRHGTLNVGSINGQSKLTAAMVHTIRGEILAGASVERLATQFAVSRAAIRDAACGRRWSHIPGSIQLRKVRDPESGRFISVAGVANSGPSLTKTGPG